MSIELDLVQTLAVTAVLLVLGEAARRHVRVLERFAIPAPVIGGFAFAILVLILRQTGLATVTIDSTLQAPAMLAFFTTVGLGASLGLLRTGGRFLILYLVACWSVAIFQNVIGIGLAKVFGIDPLLGIMAGAVSQEGGHGAAAAFGPTAEAMGAQGATAVAIAAATFGLISGSLTGGPLATWLIRRNRLPITTRALSAGEERDQAQLEATENGSPVRAATLIPVLAVLAVVMVLGTLLGGWLGDLFGITLPAYVGAMLVAIVVRNLNDARPVLPLPARELGLIGDLTLAFFLTQAMMGLRIWDLAGLALPLVVILLAQVVALALFAWLVVFRLLGRSYDAAVICGGLMGHGLGGTPNAIANMDAIGRRYGLQSRVALVVVPLSGAVLIDIVALPWIVFCMNVVG